MKRRDFLKASTGLPLMASARALPASPIQSAPTPAPGILEVGGQKQLFLDDWLITIHTLPIRRNEMKRRDFLKASTGLPLMASARALPASPIQSAPTPAPGILEVGGQKQLFLDDWLIEDARHFPLYVPSRETPG